LNGAIDYFTHEREGGIDWHRNGKTIREEGYSTDLLGAEAVRFIKSRDRSRRFFLYVPFNAPHGPLQAPRPLIEKYAAVQNPRRRTFCAMVDALDTAAGRILSAIDEEGLRDNTIVLFFSDNGGPTNLGARNTPLRGAKATTFEGGMRVPAFLRWPGHLKAGTQSAQVLTAMDVFPTLCGAAGVKPQNKLTFDGKNLWPMIESGRTEPRENLFFGVEAGPTTYLALRDRDWKLVREISDSVSRDYLFRLDQDPEEKNDLSAQHADLVKDLAARIEKWRALYPPGGIHHTDHPPPGWKAPERWADAAT
jgi:arylsulfatase B